ncbi:hypothetical protein D9611_009233 [Ephemerocybe angulata]|uniref:Uncharacterized protein n=1 Tax=Ephemerocybe angulata TaxID=980116 RepID=A0A8H5BH01_9AGAR|nr:hypothetical protein D9611_009233 [Tulosesus angulatus]
MSGLSPRRIRSRTSDITEFFRTSHSSSSTRHPDNDVSTHSQLSTYTLDVPSTSSQTPSLLKKKSSRIPFLGRSRKKSNPSGSDADALSARESTDVGELSSGPYDRRHTVEIPEPLPPSRLSALVAPSPVKPSLGSKLAAHFQPRTRKLSALGAKPVPVPSSTASRSNNNSLAPPELATRGSSLDSGSSGGRSPTPRAQPMITVSYSTTDDLEEYKDLFTLPSRPKRAAKPAPSPDATPRQGNTPESSEESPSATPTTLSSRITPSDAPRRGSAPTVLDGSRHRSSKNQAAEHPPKPPPKSSRKSSAEKSSQDSSSTPRSSDGKDSTRSSLSDKLSGPSLPVPRRVSVTPSTPAADYSAQQRLRMRQQTQASPAPSPTPSNDKRNRPPAIPLPSPPSSPTLPPSHPSISRTSSGSSIPTSRSMSGRPRANTAGSIASLASSPLSQSTVPEAPTPQPTDPRSILTTQSPDIDLSSATPDQLREVIDARNKQCDELATYVLNLTEKHVVEKASLEKKVSQQLAEKTALEKKVSQLEKEMLKKENQIKGLMWLVHNNKNPPATDFPPNLTLPPSPAPSQEPLPPKPISRLSTMRRQHLSDDSGTESHLTSGAESIRTSETSGNESGSIRRGKGRRPFMLGDSSYNFYRAAVGKRMLPPNSLAPDSALPDLPHKRSSLSSASLSPSSSTSSLLPPSPSVTVSSLSAIPESPTGVRKSTEQQEGRSPNRAAHRMSSSSMASSSTAASSAYASNLKRSRPPSIAQVLEHSPNMDDVLEKLRPFQPTS